MYKYSIILPNINRNNICFFVVEVFNIYLSGYIRSTTLISRKLGFKGVVQWSQIIFSNPYFFATWWRNPLKCQRSTATGCNVIGIQKLAFVIIAQLLYSPFLCQWIKKYFLFLINFAINTSSRKTRKITRKQHASSHQGNGLMVYTRRSNGDFTFTVVLHMFYPYRDI